MSSSKMMAFRDRCEKCCLEDRNYLGKREGKHFWESRVAFQGVLCEKEKSGERILARDLERY